MDSLLALAVRSGRILRIGLPDGSVEVITDQAGPMPDGITVESGLICWTTMGRPEVHGPTEADRDYSRADGGVHAIAPDGTGRRDVLATGRITTGKQIAGNGRGTLYWSDREGCRVSRVGLDGTGLQDLVLRHRDDTWLQECVGVAVDDASLYWSQKGPAKGGRGRVFRAGLDLLPGETPEDRTDIELLWDALPEPVDLHVHDGWLYWTDRGAAPDGNSLNRARLPVPGAVGEPPETLARGFAEAIGLAIGDGYAYVSDLGGHIREIPLPGTPGAEREVIALGEAVTGLAAG